MTKEEIIKMAREAGWSGIYTQWREPDGSPDWTPVKESLTVPVTMEQIERFAALVAAAERERIIAANAPEIERVNAYIKELEEAVKAQREACAAMLDENAMACENPIYRSLLQSNADAIRARGAHDQG